MKPILAAALTALVVVAGCTTPPVHIESEKTERPQQAEEASAETADIEMPLDVVVIAWWDSRDQSDRNEICEFRAELIANHGEEKGSRMAAVGPAIAMQDESKDIPDLEHVDWASDEMQAAITDVLELRCD